MWIKRPIIEVKAQLVKAAKKLGIPEEILVNAYNVAQLESFSENDWRILQNTNAGRVVNPNHAIDIADSMGEDIYAVFATIKADEKISAPVVLYDAGKKPYLIDGDLKMVACQGLGIQPMIVSLYL